MNPLDKLVNECVKERTPEELALGWLRYEALRRLSPRLFAELHLNAIQRQAPFDDLVTEELLKWKQSP